MARRGKITAAKIQNSLLQQLEAKGSRIELYESLIDDYVWFWKQEQEMQRDIQKRGRVYSAVSAQGKEYEKNNPAVKDALMYSKQMIAILDTLGLNTKTVVSPEHNQGNDDLG